MGSSSNQVPDVFGDEVARDSLVLGVEGEGVDIVLPRIYHKSFEDILLLWVDVERQS